MAEREKVYQILVVNRAFGINAIIPDTYCYDNIDEALVDVTRRAEAFINAGESFEYKGVINGLGDIAKIYRTHEVEVDTNECYIYEVKVKTKYGNENSIVDNL